VWLKFSTERHPPNSGSWTVWRFFGVLRRLLASPRPAQYDRPSFDYYCRSAFHNAGRRERVKANGAFLCFLLRASLLGRRCFLWPAPVWARRAQHIFLQSLILPAYGSPMPESREAAQGPSRHVIWPVAAAGVIRPRRCRQSSSSPSCCPLGGAPCLNIFFPQYTRPIMVHDCTAPPIP
jgi:hypothetical protein